MAARFVTYLDRWCVNWYSRTYRREATPWPTRDRCNNFSRLRHRPTHCLFSFTYSEFDAKRENDDCITLSWNITRNNIHRALLFLGYAIDRTTLEHRYASELGLLQSDTTRCCEILFDPPHGLSKEALGEYLFTSGQAQFLSWCT